MKGVLTPRFEKTLVFHSELSVPPKAIHGDPPDFSCLNYKFRMVIDGFAQNRVFTRYLLCFIISN